MDESLAESLRRVDALRIDAPATTASSGLQALSLDDLLKRAGDRAASKPDRLASLAALVDRARGDRELADAVLALIDDPDSELVLAAIAAFPPFDSRVAARLRLLLDDPRPPIWEAAASALARKKDRSILPLMLAWAREGDFEQRRAGLSAVAFLLIPEEHLAVVEAICEEGPRDDRDEALLVEALRVADSRVAFWRKNARVEADDD